MLLARLRPARPPRPRLLPSVLHAASSSSSSPAFLVAARRRADALTPSSDASHALARPPRRLEPAKTKTISSTAAALALRFALVAVAAIVDASKPLGLRYTDVDYDVLKDGARYMAEGGSPFQRATYRYSPLVSYPLLLDVKTGLPVAKLVFCVFDVLLGNAMGHLASQRGASYHVRLLWLFNPVSHRSVHARVLGRRFSVSCVTSFAEQAGSRESGFTAGPGDASAALPVIYAAPFLYNFCFEARRRLP